jgi:predicted MFS family arabinose efflux permease
MRAHKGFEALQEPQFRLLWLGRATSALGDALIPVALAFAVIEETGSATDLGLVLAAYTVSRVALIVVGGVWADRLPRRAVMLGADLVRVFSQALLGALLIADAAEIWHLAVGGAVAGGAHAFFGPASTAFVPSTVSPARLQQANALIAMTWSGANVLGPAVSGLLVAAVGPGWVFVIDAGTFAASAAFLFAMRVPEGVVEERQPFLREVAGGVGEIARRSWLAVSLASFALANVTIATYLVLGPLVAERALDGARDWGLAVAGGAVGGVLGGVLAARYEPERPLFFGNLVMLIQPALLLALIPPLPVLGLAAAAALAFGAISFFNALWQTVLQEEVPPSMLSRVSALDAMVSFVFMPLGFAIAGPLAAEIGIDATLAAAAVLSAAAVLLPLCFPSVRRLSRRDDSRPSPWPAYGSAGESRVPAPLDPLP